jgi:hypothetical protein
MSTITADHAYPVSSGPAISPARMPQAWVTDDRIVQVERGLAVSYHDHLTEPDRHDGGYCTSLLSRPSQRVTMMAVTGQSPVPRLRRLQ